MLTCGVSFLWLLAWDEYVKGDKKGKEKKT